jgi:HD-GYP domain-containing protein (c-di-GMP phosphodiesterase class II)
LGAFVYARFYDTSAAQIADYADPAYSGLGEVKRLADAAPPRHLEPGEIWSETLRLRGRLHVQFALPISDRHGSVVAYARAVFAVAPEAAAAIRARLARNVALAIGIVLATTALLYPVIVRLMHRLSDFSSDLLAANLETLSLLGSAIALRDSDTDVHNYRVTLYAVRLAEALPLGVQDIQALIKGAFLHDVGKIGIRDDILLKPGRLSEEEFRIMKTHVVHGLDIVGRSAWLADAAAVVGGHHEKFDGSGYPRGTRDHAIPVAARIFAIVDVFDALTSRRPYKEPMSFEAAVEILEKGRGSHFDPELLDSFNSIARTLYERYAGREDEGLHEELAGLARQYYSAGLASLRY